MGLSDLERLILRRADEQMLSAKWVEDWGGRTSHPHSGHPYPGAAERAERVRELHALGWLDGAIAKELGVVRQCVANIRQRLGLRSNFKKGGAR